jgi:lysophospholipase L1-like esterase
MNHRPPLLACVLIALLAPFTFGQTQALQDGDRVAIIGDSITEQKQYSLYIEDYLLMCKPKQHLQAMQFGWGGETSWGFLARMNADLLPYKPTVATTCYGMNDGGYGPLKEETVKRYIESMDKIVAGMKDTGVRFIVVGSPGAVDSTSFKVLGTKPEVYNKTLAQLAEAAHGVATKHGVAFADVHAAMMDVMEKSKAKFGGDYYFAGADGVHPGPNGHLVMAYAFLKALGCDGNIGEITLDLTSGKATASEGHKVISSGNGSIEIESSRYPFCFTSDELLKIAELFPFNQDLNRLTLKVSGAGNGKVKVIWGEGSKTFAAEDLQAGINLAAEFPTNPFVEPFKKAEAAIRAQQEFETPMIKTLYHKQVAPSDEQKAEQERAEARTKQQELAAAAARSVAPVKHTIKIEAAP